MAIGHKITKLKRRLTITLTPRDVHKVWCHSKMHEKARRTAHRVQSENRLKDHGDCTFMILVGDEIWVSVFFRCDSSWAWLHINNVQMTLFTQLLALDDKISSSSSLTTLASELPTAFVCTLDLWSWTSLKEDFWPNWTLLQGCKKSQ